MRISLLSRVSQQPPSLSTRTSAIDILTAVLFAVVTWGYFSRAFALTGTTYWFDEVLAVWTARMPDVGGVWHALKNGSEFTPPLFDLMLHGLIRLGFTSALAMRLPSILAIYIAALAIGLFVKRRASWQLAALAAAMVLTSGIFGYALQVRPYACLAAIIALGLLVWDGLPEQGRIGWRAPLLCALLTIAVGLHFYAIVLVGLFGLAEMARSGTTRRLRIPVLFAIALAGASILLWLPLIHADAAFLAGDRDASVYYGHPTPWLLADSYLQLTSSLFLEVACIIMLFFLWQRRTNRTEPAQPGDKAWLGLAILFSCVPVAIFIFSLIVTHSFASRYTITVVLGLALLLSYATSRLNQRVSTIAALAALAVLAVGSQVMHAFPAESPTRKAAIALAKSAPAGTPLATLNGGRFLEIAEAAPSLIPNLVLLRAPPNSGDPTNAHQAYRWAAMRSDLKVLTATQMLNAHPCFLLLSDRSELFEDDITRVLPPSVPVQPLGVSSPRLYKIGSCQSAI